MKKKKKIPPHVPVTNCPTCNSYRVFSARALGVEPAASLFVGA